MPDSTNPGRGTLVYRVRQFLNPSQDFHGIATVRARVKVWHTKVWWYKDLKQDGPPKDWRAAKKALDARTPDHEYTFPTCNVVLELTDCNNQINLELDWSTGDSAAYIKNQLGKSARLRAAIVAVDDALQEIGPAAIEAAKTRKRLTAREK